MAVCVIWVLANGYLTLAEERGNVRCRHRTAAGFRNNPRDRARVRHRCGLNDHGKPCCMKFPYTGLKRPAGSISGEKVVSAQN
ncbi:hypothetical protein C8J57DRAFT_1306223 [Mycena rebaudengoi]|nr:hypothetical protein C8J57DRAFT_1306223 [Mycena rebaudengoi]